MSGFSWMNPFPMVFGDEPTEIELAYDGLHEAAGANAGDPTQSALAPKDPDPLTLSSLADLEVKCLAISIGSAATAVEHALWESFPHTMVDQLPAWEKILLIAPIAPTVLERQQAVMRKLTLIPDATPPGLRATLYRISPNLGPDSLPYALWTVSMLGKNFGPLPGVTPTPPAYRAGAALALFGQSSAWPNFSDAFVTRVRYVLGAGETEPPREVLREARATLLEVLPAWQAFEVYTLSIDDGTEGEGFYFDGGPGDDSFFDVTAFGTT